MLNRYFFMIFLDLNAKICIKNNF